MNRRHFLSSTLAASALSVAAPVESLSQTAPAGTPEFYELRRYFLVSGPQTKLAESYFGEALIPAMNRMGVTPIGAFALDYGPETPTYYLLLPSSSLETLVTADLHLAKDDAFLKAAAPFWGAPASSPAYRRVESSLLRAFSGRPKLVLPAASATKGKRIFQLRTYESPSNAAHVRKIEMFHSGEFDSFANAGADQVFYGDTLVGPRLPSLTYMLSFSDIDALNISWDKFRADAGWKKLSSSPRFNYEAIVSDVSNLILRPLACSQI